MKLDTNRQRIIGNMGTQIEKGRILSVCSKEKPLTDPGILEPGQKATMMGKVTAVIDPTQAHCPPFSDMFTVSIARNHQPVAYLKFRTKQELERFPVIRREERVVVDGCVHIYSKSGGPTQISKNPLAIKLPGKNYGNPIVFAVSRAVTARK